ncbi:MAG TPA: class I poly(R)-hydroxyalkanoic acid synthase [Bacteroidia bacterium]|nr:class I poly(R)-hydroxyalkanoic acid synthase [Bacteroidia bacterium]
MENTPQKSFQDLSEGITKASQKIIQNYLENKTGYNHDLRDISSTFSDFNTKLMASPKEMEKIKILYEDYFNSQQELWKRITERASDGKKEYQPVISPEKGDKRFRAPEWDEAPYYFDFVKQSYLLVSKLVSGIIETSEIDEKAKKKLNFYSQHYMDALSPSNFIATNPEAIKLAQQTNGQSLLDGFKNLLKDIETGRISQTQTTAFEPGKNIAITPGAVIYENELIQLIQYKPTTKNVYEIPLVIIPPWINKYYILDLRPENSLVKFMVDQGFEVYIISWKNPTPDMGHLSFDDYVEKGTLKAIEVAQSISKVKKVNTLGYCLGGTLLGTALAVLAARESKEENPVNSATFLATMIDFSDVGPMGDVIDNALIKKLERGELLRDGLMHGHDMERAFNLIRANDLIWSFVVNNYLKGKEPTAFDLLYWSNDNTNLPAKMYLYYLKHMVFENKLSRKKALRICDTQIDVGKINIPVFVIGMQDDHISPPQTNFTTTELVSGPVEFILGESGHVMGVANPPSKHKYGYYLNGKLEHGFETWKQTAKFHEGSWWTAWSERLAKKSGKQKVAVKNLGNTKYKIIEPAPGRYVHEKCDSQLKIKK